jgi:hypothetical protein
MLSYYVIIRQYNQTESPYVLIWCYHLMLSFNWDDKKKSRGNSQSPTGTVDEWFCYVVFNSHMVNTTDVFNGHFTIYNTRVALPDVWGRSMSALPNSSTTVMDHKQGWMRWTCVSWTRVNWIPRRRTRRMLFRLRTWSWLPLYGLRALLVSLKERV